MENLYGDDYPHKLYKDYKSEWDAVKRAFEKMGLNENDINYLVEKLEDYI